MILHKKKLNDVKFVNRAYIFSNEAKLTVQTTINK